MTKLSSVNNVKYVWLFHGTSDEVIPCEQSHSFVTCLPPNTASVVLIPQAGHNFRSPLGRKGLEPLVAALKESVLTKITL